jgi:hypothetical protein
LGDAIAVQKLANQGEGLLLEEVLGEVLHHGPFHGFGDARVILYELRLGRVRGEGRDRVQGGVGRLGVVAVKGIGVCEEIAVRMVAVGGLGEEVHRLLPFVLSIGERGVVVGKEGAGGRRVVVGLEVEEGLGGSDVLAEYVLASELVSRMLTVLSEEIVGGVLIVALVLPVVLPRHSALPLSTAIVARVEHRMFEGRLRIEVLIIIFLHSRDGFNILVVEQSSMKLSHVFEIGEDAYFCVGEGHFSV